MIVSPEFIRGDLRHTTALLVLSLQMDILAGKRRGPAFRKPPE